VVAGSESVKFFLSWCHADQRDKAALVDDRLLRCLRIQQGIEVQWWEDSLLLPGEKWREKLADRIEACDYGVLLLSPAFFASDFITAHELPAFVGPEAAKNVIPVGLSRVNLDGTHRTLGVEEHQVFVDRATGRFFTELDRRGKDRFAFDLADAVRRKVLADRRPA
jgi:TIR domain